MENVHLRITEIHVYVQINVLVAAMDHNHGCENMSPERPPYLLLSLTANCIFKITSNNWTIGAKKRV